MSGSILVCPVKHGKPLLFRTMHHQEIGQLVEILEKYTDKKSEICTVRIEYVMHNNWKRGHNTPYVGGIRLVGSFGNSQIKIQVNELNQDSNCMKVLYYARENQNSPDLSLSSAPQYLNCVQLESMLQVLIEVENGTMCLRTIKAVGAIGDFKVVDIPEPHPIAA